MVVTVVLRPTVHLLGGAVKYACAGTTHSKGQTIGHCPQSRAESPHCGQEILVGALAMAGPLVQLRGPEGQLKHGRARTKKAPKPRVQYVKYDPDDNSDAGQLQPIAVRVLMKVLYAARMCRFDLLRAVCVLAQRITKWDATCDCRLHRLMSYIHGTLGNCLTRWVGDAPAEVRPHLYTDADLAGCADNNGYHHGQRSGTYPTTSG